MNKRFKEFIIKKLIILITIKDTLKRSNLNLKLLLKI
jgi:hypothetical protein